MEEIVVDRLLVGQDPAWRKWPDSADTDYAAIEALRLPSAYERGGVRLRMTTRWLPVYAAYPRAGVPALPLRPYDIDNTLAPDPRVVAALVAGLERAAAAGCRVCWWEHGHQCYPAVARRMRELFPLCVLQFADDCPGSSERKTFPVARYFDVVYHSMNVFDFATGARVAAQYQARGVPYTKFVPMGPTPGLVEALAGVATYAAAGDVLSGAYGARKAAAAAAGALGPPLFAFVGYRGAPGSPRERLLGELAAGRGALDAAGVGTRLHGVDMPDGPIEPRDCPTPGRAVAPLYARATLGLNLPVSSLFNSRLIDLWLAGVAQLVHDPHGELAPEGFRAGAHYLPYDGTFAGLRAAALAAAADPAGTAAVATRAAAAAAAWAARRTPTAAYGDIFFDHLARLRAG